VSPAIEIAHSKALEKCNAIYPLHRSEIEILPVSLGTRVITKDGLFAGKVPRKLVIILLTSGSMNGSYSDSPYRFQSGKVHRIDLTLDGEPVADTPISCDFANNLYMRAYHNMYAAMNKSYDDKDLDISMSDFKNMYPMFCFDLTSDSCGNTSEHFELERKGTLRIVMGLQNVVSTMYLLFYAEFESSLEINKYREVLL
jgi:hypothetical protein